MDDPGNHADKSHCHSENGSERCANNLKSLDPTHDDLPTWYLAKREVMLAPGHEKDCDADHTKVKNV